MVTLKQIAKELKVSIMTVSRALNNDALVSPKTKEKIIKKANELEYIPNYVAKSMVSQKSKTIGLVMSIFSGSFFSDVCKGVSKITNEKGYEILLCSSSNIAEKEEEKIRALLSRKIEGFIISPLPRENPKVNIYKFLMDNHIPFVLVDHIFENTNYSCVISDDFNGAYDATMYLIKLGHKRIGHIAGPNIYSTAKERLRGYRQALKDSKIKEEIIEQGGASEERGIDAMNKLLIKQPTAVFCFNDWYALGAMESSEKFGLKVPDDISIIGFSDSLFAPLLKVPLTTVRQMPIVMGELSANLLFEKIEKKIKTEKKVVVPAKLIIRDSCKKITQ